MTAGPSAALEALLTPAGAELLARAEAALAAGEELPVGARLRAAQPAELVAAAFAQAELRARARGKFTRAGRMFFTRAGLEQASSEAAARHRAERFAGVQRLADLCTGIGGDLLALAAGRSVLAVDRDPLHLRMAGLNAAAYGAADGVRPLLADVRQVDLGGLDGVFVDPARRAGGRRLATGDSQPPLAWCLRLADAVPAVAVKAAPGLALDVVPPGWEVEFVADGRGLKEAVLWSPALASARTRATVLPAGVTPAAGDTPGGSTPAAGDTLAAGDLLPAGGALPVGRPGRYLFDPSPAVTRAGLVADLGRRLGAWQLDGRIAFLSADDPVRTPFARLLRVERSLPWDVAVLARQLRGLGVGAVDVRRRGLAGDVAQVARRLRLRGGRKMTLVMTRVAGRPWALVCVEPGEPAL